MLVKNLPPSEKINKEKIIETFGLDVDVPKRVNLSVNDSEGKLYSLNLKDLDTEIYIVDSPQGREIACNPYIVGKELGDRCLSSATFAIKAFEHIVDLRETPFLVLNILRAGPGYRMADALEQSQKTFYQAWVRTKYIQSSYRDHIERKLNVIYEDFKLIPAKRKVNLIVPDTFATGASADVAIKKTFEDIIEKSSTIDNIFLYGFISEDSVRYLSKALKAYGVRIIALALEDLMKVAWNNYDMAIYGFDLSYYEKFGKLKKLSSIVPEEVLDDCLPCYAPGSDQPGDFSSRQSKLFNGEGWEYGPIFSHLVNSLTMIRGLERISKDEPWYEHEEIFKMKKENLRIKCLKYLPHSILYSKDSFGSIKSLLKSY